MTNEDGVPSDIELRLAAVEAQLRIQKTTRETPRESYVLLNSDPAEFNKKLQEYTKKKGHQIRGNVNIDTHPQTGAILRAWCLMDVYDEH